MREVFFKQEQNWKGELGEEEEGETEISSRKKFELKKKLKDANDEVQRTPSKKKPSTCETQTHQKQILMKQKKQDQKDTATPK